MVKNQPANAGDMGSIPGILQYPKNTPVFSSGRSHRQRSLEGWATVHGVSKQLDTDLETNQPQQ